MIMRVINLLLLCCLGQLALAQNTQKQAEAILHNKGRYLSAMGESTTLEDADQSALQQLISQISVTVQSQFKIEASEITKDAQSSSQSAVESVIKTYSKGTLRDAKQMVIPMKKGGFRVLRYIEKTDIQKVFAERTEKVMDYVSLAEKSEEKGEIDYALRYYYNAYCLLRSLPDWNTVKRNNEPLSITIPEKMERILGRINCSVKHWEGNQVDLFFTYNGEPVNSLAFQVHNGYEYGHPITAKNGNASVELSTGNSGSSQLTIRYVYEHLQDFADDENVKSVVETLLMRSFGEKQIVHRGTKKEQKATWAQAEEAQATATAGPDTEELTQQKKMEKAVQDIVKAIGSRKYESLQQHFTEEGMQMFNTLIKSYGKVSVASQQEVHFFKLHDKTICRSIPLTFRLPKQTFNEDVCLTFNAEGKVESLAFGLNRASRDDILTTNWDGEIQMELINFLENYQTAFALKRLDFIGSLFSDDAVIITGSMLRKAAKSVEQNKMTFTNAVKYTRHNKEQYLEKLAQCFDRNDYINIRLTDNDVRRMDAIHGKCYGILIHQDYYSTTYSDTGYLFLIADFNDSEKPTIILRTWQPERDPGIYESEKQRKLMEGSRYYGLYNVSSF
jgi:hypothetical protein